MSRPCPIVHHPVLLKEVLKGLELRPGATVLDATVGLGGHAEAFLAAIGATGHLIAVDRDKQALQMAQARCERYGDQMIGVHGNFSDLDQILKEIGHEELDAALFDLGVSSLQLEDPERGFSFTREGPLDMRMDQEQDLKAEELVNRSSLPTLTRILREYGQERWAGRITRAIVRNRPFSTTTQLSEVVRRAVPQAARREKIHPSTRAFQAIRIAVNRELELLPEGLQRVLRHLKPNGRIAVLAYHSLEDRIIKTLFREEARSGMLEVLTRKPIRPSEEEVARNPRSRSARLRLGRRPPNSP